MKEDVKPSWYFMVNPSFGRHYHFYMGKTEGVPDGVKHWCLNISLYYISFGKGY